MTGGYASMPKEFGERCLSEISEICRSMFYFKGPFPARLQGVQSSLLAGCPGIVLVKLLGLGEMPVAARFSPMTSNMENV